MALTLDEANRVLEATLAKAKQLNIKVSAAVVDAGGRLVRVIADGRLSAGPHVLAWDGRDGRGSAAATGVYFYELRAGASTSRRRMLLIR